MHAAFLRLKPKQARTANKGDSRPNTEVTGEFSARPCDPPHLYMKNAPMAQKFCDQGCKTTFTTQSAQSGLEEIAVGCPLSGCRRTSKFKRVTSAFDVVDGARSRHRSAIGWFVGD